MRKLLVAVAVLALAALGTSIIATVVLRSSISRQSSQIGALQRAEKTDHKMIATLESKLAAGAAHIHTKQTAEHLLCTQLPLPVRQTGVALAAANSLMAIKRGC